MPVDMTQFNTLFTSASLIVAFFGGMVMLFAPCCITLMLPAYLGTVFKSRSRIILMTLIFAAGVGSVMLPLVLGARFLASFFTQYHLYIYAGGSLLMIGIGLMSLFNKTISLPFASKLQSPRVTNAASAYALGVVSGISSSCCAPVLLGALSLAALSPSVWQATAVGLAYTLGIVFPLLILSLFLEKGLWKWTLKLQQKSLSFGNLKVSIANFTSFVIFTVTGLLFLFLAISNRIQMNVGTLEFSIKLKAWVDTVTQPIRSVPYSEYIFGIVLLVALILFIRSSLKQSKHSVEEPEQNEENKLK